MTRMWLKTNSDITAETITDAQIGGLLPAIVSDPIQARDPFYGVIDVDDWSLTEIVPAPHNVPTTGYMVLYGDDPAYVRYVFYATETEAAIRANQGKTFGYISVTLHREAMIPPLPVSEPPDMV